MTREQLKSVLEPYIEQILNGLSCLNGNAANTLESDPQEICIAGAASGLQWVVKDNTGAPTGVVFYTDLLGAVIPTPAVFTFGSCATNSDILIEQLCLCDDVNGDGSLVVRYIQFYQYDPATNTIVVTGTWNTTLTAPYVPVNPTNCNSIGTAPQVVQDGVDLIGPVVWVRPNNIISMTLHVRQVGNIAALPTYTGYSGSSRILDAGDVKTWGVLEASQVALQGNFQITLNAGDIISIHYTQIV